MVKEEDDPFFQLGEHTYKVPMKLHRVNREGLCERLKATTDLPTNSIVLLQGGCASSFAKYCTDTDVTEFRQEPYFQWMFGCREPDFYGIVEVDTAKTTLFVPKFAPSYNIWMGKIEPPEFFKKKYGVDEAYYTEEIHKVLKGKEPLVLLKNKGCNTDSGSTTKEAFFEGIKDFEQNNTILHPVVSEARVFKSDLELDLLRWVNKISSQAHKEVMLYSKPGMYEFQSESVFLNHCYSQGGMRHMSYTCICGSGHNGSILHYGHAAAPNDKKIEDGDMCLYDLGGEYHGYASDITCSFPSNGKFTEDQKLIYNMVLRSNRAVLAHGKPEVKWADMHKLSQSVILAGLKEGGLLVGDVDEMMAAGLGRIFMPHGLGHLLGLDVHDVGGYNGAERIHEHGMEKLRTTRVLKERMVLTIEPGCYFIDPLLDSALDEPKLSKFMVKEKIDRFRGSGGVRIEDNVIVTKDGLELITCVPRTVEEIEKFMEERKYHCLGDSCRL